MDQATQGSAQALGRSVEPLLRALLQEVRMARRGAVPRRVGSGRAAIARPFDVTFPAAAPPPTPYCPTPQVLPLVAHAHGHMLSTLASGAAKRAGAN
jgi:hypothetical protein